MLGICLVGTGGIAAEHARAFAAIGGTQPHWVVSRLEAEAAKFAGQWKFEQAGASLEGALSDPRVGLVVITSPSGLHATQTLQALDAGKDVVIEIPVALNLAESEQVSQRARQSGKRVFVCHTMRSFPAIREVRRRVQAGELHVTQIHGFFAIPRRRNQGFVGQRHWIDNLLWHHACHQVDAALWTLGVESADRVSAMLGRAHPKFGMAVDVSVQFRTASQQLVTQSLTYNTEQFCWELNFIGDEDVLTFRNGQFLNEKNESLLPELDWRDLRAQNSSMIAALTGGHASDYDIDSSLPTMRLLHRAQESAEGKLGL